MAGLVDLAADLTFRHPLIRSAVYGGARPSDRRAAHRTLATATNGATHPDSQALHRAAAAIGPDEEVALALDGAAHLAGKRGSHAARAALFTRAAELTPDATAAARRRLAAAEAALVSGAPMQTTALVTQALPGPRRIPAFARAPIVWDGSCADPRRLKAASGAMMLLAAAKDLLELDIELGPSECSSNQVKRHSWRDTSGAGKPTRSSSKVAALAQCVAARATVTRGRRTARGSVRVRRRPASSAAVRHLPRGAHLPPAGPSWSRSCTPRLGGAMRTRTTTSCCMTAAASRASGDLAVLRAALEACARTALWAGRF